MVPCSMIRGSFVKPIARWSYTVHPWGRSTSGYVSYTSPPNLGPEDWAWPINRWGIQYIYFNTFFYLLF